MTGSPRPDIPETLGYGPHDVFVERRAMSPLMPFFRQASRWLAIPEFSVLSELGLILSDDEFTRGCRSCAQARYIIALDTPRIVRRL
jgi:hypothetical protein